MSYLQDFGLGEVYPSPPEVGDGEGDGEADSPTSHDASPTAPKAPAKRKRENRYKNAPPSVLSVRMCPVVVFFVYFRTFFFF